MNSRVQLLLLAFAVFLVGFIVAQMLYYFSLQKRPERVEIRKLVITVTPAPQHSSQCLLSTCSLWFPSPSVNQALSELQLASLRDLKKGVIKNSIISYTYEGIVSNVKYVDKGEYNEVSFSVKADSGETNIFFHNNSYTVIEKNGNIVPFNSLGDGKKIRGRVEYELIQEKFIKVVITILE